MVEPTVVEPEDNPPIKSKREREKKVDTPVITQRNPNDSGVDDRYPRDQEYQNFKCVLYLLTVYYL